MVRAILRPVLPASETTALRKGHTDRAGPAAHSMVQVRVPLTARTVTVRRREEQTAPDRPVVSAGLVVPEDLVLHLNL